MNRTYEEWLKYYENATKEQVIEDMMLDIKKISRLNNIIDEKNKENNILKEALLFIFKDYKMRTINIDELEKAIKELKEGKE